MKEEDLRHLLDALPAGPGVYLMKGHDGRVLYVGKAKSLRARVRQYFAPRTSDTRFFLEGLAGKLGDIEVVLTSSEKEALLLEHTLIHRYEPRYNVRLTDDKRFLCVRLDMRARWPRLELIRVPVNDGALYFGPYDSAQFARATMKLLARHFKLRTCADRAFANRARPCLQHQMGRCLGPCVLDIDREEYLAQAGYVVLFLEGRMDDLLRRLRREMASASEALEYERAASLRDQIAAVERTIQPQRVTDFVEIDQDVVGMHRDGDLTRIAVLEVVRGRLVGKTDYRLEGIELPDEEVLSSFIVQRYSGVARIPDEVIVPTALPDAALLEEILKERRGKRVKVLFPRRGPRVDQLRLAEMNATQAAKAEARDREDVGRTLEALARKLGLAKAPRRIECVDIAHLGGKDAVGAIGVVVNGRVARRAGRTYGLRSAGAGDDFAAIAEVLSRRFRRAAANEDGWEAPELLVVDGGRGQLAIARRVLEELGLEDQPVVALAKARSGEAAVEDRVFLPGRVNPISLRQKNAALMILAMARDEAHRLANRAQGKKRRKRAMESELDSIKGVGPRTKRRLLKELGSVAGVREAALEEIASVAGVGPVLAARIKEALGDGSRR